MKDLVIQIERARPDDAVALQATLALLRRADLPEEGVAEHFGGFLLARDGERVIGSVGLELNGSVALLRSLAVAPECRGTGLGQRLTECAIATARAAGAIEVVLLTTTAADFFTQYFGFAAVERARYDAALAASPEWRLPRCASAVCLALPLAEGK